MVVDAHLLAKETPSIIDQYPLMGARIDKMSSPRSRSRSLRFVDWACWRRALNVLVALSRALIACISWTSWPRADLQHHLAS